MFRVVGRRLGGRVGKSGGPVLLLSGSTTAATKAGKVTAATAVNPPSVQPKGARQLVDIVLPRVDCSLLKHVLSSSSSSSTSTDIPDVARVLRLDYTSRDGKLKKKARGATEAEKADAAHPLADILLVNRIHAAVMADTKKRALKGETEDAASPWPAPLLVLVETNLLSEDAEVQQFIIRNALSMHPLPPTVEVQLTSAKKDAAGPPLRATTPPLTVLVLNAELTERVRALAKLPAPPSPVLLPSEKEEAVVVVPAAEENTPTQGTAARQGPPHQSSAEAAGKAAKAVKAAPTASGTQPSQHANVIPPPKRTRSASAPVPKKRKGGRSTPVALSSRARPSPRQRRQQQKKKRATALPRKRAAGKLTMMRSRRARVAPAAHRRPQRHQSSPKRALLSAPSVPPRLLSIDDTTEKLLWASRAGRPLPLSVLAPLINPDVFEKMRAAALEARHKAIAGGGTDAPLSLHTVVYRAGTQSSAQSVWLGVVQAAAELASALCLGKSLLPAAVTELAAKTHASFTADAPCSRPGRPSSPASSARRRSNSGSHREGRVGYARKGKAPLDAKAVVTETPYVYMLIHTSLPPQDAAVLQQELDYQYVQLKATPAGAELAGISVLSTQDVSPTQLRYVLEHGVAHEATAMSLNASASASTHNTEATEPRQGYVASVGRNPLSPDSAAVSRIFQEIYLLLTEQPELLRLAHTSPASTSELARADAGGAGVGAASGEGSSGSTKRHPDALVADALRIAALTQVLLLRKETQLREEFAAAQQRSAVSADSEAVARAAQKVEIKTMVTEAVEEVSVRHEQATAHLVKTLSSMVGQWSLEKLSDTLEAIIRDEVKPIMDVLVERLGTAAQGMRSTSSSTHQKQSSSSLAEGPDAAATAAGEGLAAAIPAVSEPESSYSDRSSEAQKELLEGQGEMRETLEHVLTQLRELTARASSAFSAAAEAVSAPAAAAKAEEAWALNAQHAVDEERLLQALRDLQQQHQVELQQALSTLKEDLLPSAQLASCAGRQAAANAAATAVSPEIIEPAVSSAVKGLSHAIRQSIQSSVTDQLDRYCEMHRSFQDCSGKSIGESEPSLPILPVTSFELEEMLTRTVDFAIREWETEANGHIRAAMLKALQEHAASAAPTLSPVGADAEDGHESNSYTDKRSMKAALEELWAQVKAEAAEKEAVKLSQHNRQLLRLFRRQQHLQRANKDAAVDGAPAAPGNTGLAIMAVEEAVRAAMHPYMTQMQAALTAATAKSRAAPNPLSSPIDEE
ncbi:hypothetical protein ABL78_1717 [Leptomonas seymouri]|uniref:Uncharacterized protein n=1 Tax=Leptomonas seymouri TaxID=5684 RepID=A0A0N1PCT7_LEPSE|nr:hypothetical protein ABL78_1717 [Leptomonas seymouri]|eukprot:KPI89154.1 hypothetical protein ABL78_1717 [Leptomonas seymouri]